MPELPEVETVARGLRRTVLGATIDAVDLRFPGAVHSAPRAFARTLIGLRFRGVRRLGKYLLIDLEPPRARPRTRPLRAPQTLITHLRMTGQLRYYPARRSPATADRHTHVVFRLRRPAGALHYRDVRKFGGFTLVATARALAQPSLAKLGPDALDALTREHLASVCAATRRPLKTLLLDQTKLAGIGNIYADELCHLIRVRPDTPANRLSTRQVGALFREIPRLLTWAINEGGTTLNDFFDASGDPGRFFAALRVFRRTGARCRRRGCRGEIVRIVLAGRATHYCPRCQPRLA